MGKPLESTHRSDYPVPRPRPGAAPVVEWLGAGVYYHRPDGVWSHRCADAGAWDDTIGIPRISDIPALLGRRAVALDGETEIEQLLNRLMLPAQRFYDSLTVEQCQALELEAEHWRIPYVWGEHEERGYLFQVKRYLTFQWNFGEK